MVRIRMEKLNHKQLFARVWLAIRFTLIVFRDEIAFPQCERIFSVDPGEFALCSVANSLRTSLISLLDAIVYEKRNICTAMPFGVLRESRGGARDVMRFMW